MSKKEYRATLYACILGSKDGTVPPPPRRWRSVHTKITRKCRPELSSAEINHLVDKIWSDIYDEKGRKEIIMAEAMSAPMPRLL